MQAGVQQGVGGALQAGPVGNGHPGEQLRLQPVGLDGMEPAQGTPEFARLGGGDRVGEDGHGHMFAQPGNGLLRNVGVHHHQLGVVEHAQPAGQIVRGDMAEDFHIVEGQRHFSVRVGDEQVGGTGSAGHLQGVGDVDAQLAAGGGHRVGEVVIPHGGKEGDLQPHKGHVVGDVPAHAPHGHPHLPGVGVPVYQGRQGAAADVLGDPPHHRHIGGGVHHIALA